MAKSSLGDKVNRLFAAEKWATARTLLKGQLAHDPDSHWLLTQLGVTYYEQRQYRKALGYFLKSKAIKSDCPLTLWNLAGAYDALGKQAAAMKVYSWLLAQTTSPEEDPCWESKEWSESLKADCVYRLGRCFEKRGDKVTADHCYRQYIELVLAGVEGTYPIDEAHRQIQKLHGSQNGKGVEARFKKLRAFLARHGANGKRSRIQKTIVVNL